MNEFCLVHKGKAFFSVYTGILLARIILHICSELYYLCFYLCYIAVPQIDLDNSAYYFREWREMLFWPPGSRTEGEYFVFTCSTLLKLSGHFHTSWVFTVGALEEGRIFWLMCADVNGLSPGQLRYSCCLTNACPFSGSA